VLTSERNFLTQKLKVPKIVFVLESCLVYLEDFTEIFNLFILNKEIRAYKKEYCI